MGLFHGSLLNTTSLTCGLTAVEATKVKKQVTEVIVKFVCWLQSSDRLTVRFISTASSKTNRAV